jgi:hypothetical protein
VDDDVATVALNRPDKMSSSNEQVVCEVVDLRARPG